MYIYIFFFNLSHCNPICFRGLDPSLSKGARAMACATYARFARCRAANLSLSRAQRKYTETLLEREKHLHEIDGHLIEIQWNFTNFQGKLHGIEWNEWKRRLSFGVSGGHAESTWRWIIEASDSAEVTDFLRGVSSPQPLLCASEREKTERHCARGIKRYKKGITRSKLSIRRVSQEC